MACGSWYPAARKPMPPARAAATTSAGVVGPPAIGAAMSGMARPRSPSGEFIGVRIGQLGAIAAPDYGNDPLAASEQLTSAVTGKVGRHAEGRTDTGHTSNRSRSCYATTNPRRAWPVTALAPCPQRIAP